MADSRALLAIGFIAVHTWLIWSNLSAPGNPLADVTHQYKDWTFNGLHGLGWVGIDHAWVYPVGALGPMLITAIGGMGQYGHAWLAQLVFFNALAVIATVIATGKTRYAWWWLAFLAALGPIAAGRIDSASVPPALIGALVIASRPAIGSALITAAAWLKVWPGAVLVAALTALDKRRSQLLGAVAVSAVFVLGTFALGGHEVFSFLTEQGSRGVQLEAVTATPWLWLGHFHHGGTPVWNVPLSTYEIVGPGTSTASALGTPVMGLVTIVICGLALIALRRGANPNAIFAPLAMALTTNLIVTNKVGSPQYETWLAVPIILGLVAATKGGPSFRVPAALALVIALLTDLIYPWNYGHLIHLRLLWITAITIRNLGVVALLGIAVADLVAQARRAKGSTAAPSAA